MLLQQVCKQYLFVDFCVSLSECVYFCEELFVCVCLSVSRICVFVSFFSLSLYLFLSSFLWRFDCVFLSLYRWMSVSLCVWICVCFCICIFDSCCYPCVSVFFCSVSEFVYAKEHNWEEISNHSASYRVLTNHRFLLDLHFWPMFQLWLRSFSFLNVESRNQVHGSIKHSCGGSPSLALPCFYPLQCYQQTKTFCWWGQISPVYSHDMYPCSPSQE